jgi:membrane-associated phospholipid phosphatase
VTSAAPAAWSGAPARDERVGRYWSDLVWLLAGAALLLLSAVPVHADRISKLEADIFRLALGLAGGGVYALAKVVKHFMLRGRPSTLLNDVIVRGASRHGLGFVSGHIGVVTALSLVAWSWLPRWDRWVLAAAVAAVFLTRIYVGAHLPLDMIGGAGLGLAVGGAVRLLLGRPQAAPSAT